MRWRQPEKGWIAPSVFIAIAEESGLIVPLGRQILLKACQQIKQWQEMGYVTVPVWGKRLLRTTGAGKYAAGDYGLSGKNRTQPPSLWP